MNINSKEIRLSLALATATILGAVITPNPAVSLTRPSAIVGQSTSPLETPTPTVTPEAPPQIKSDPPPKNPYTDIVPLVVSNLRSSSFFKRFRGSLPEDTKASITYFGPHRYAGTVVPEEGVKIRTLPDVNSEPASDVKWLDWGEQVGFEYMVTFRGKDQQLLERWILIDEKERPGTKWKCAKGWHRGQGRCFTAMQIGNEVLIDFSDVTPPPAKEVKFYSWPAPK